MKRRVVVGWAQKGLAVLPGGSSVGDVTDVFFACRRYVFRTNCLCSVGQLQCCAKERKQWRRVVLQTVTEAHQAAMLWEWQKKSRFFCGRRHAFQTAKLWKGRFVRFTAFFIDVPSDRQCQRTKTNLISQIFSRTVCNLAPFFPLECSRKRVQLLPPVPGKKSRVASFPPGGDRRCSLLLEN